MIIQKERINISNFLKTRIEFFNEVANASGMIFITNIDNDLKVMFNEVKLQRIIDNNISNAIKYSFPDSPIFLKLIKEDKKIIFSVKTHSDQILDEKKIFTSFYRESDSKGGFGMGLNIVKDICDDIGVKINLESKKKLQLLHMNLRQYNEYITIRR